MARLWYYARQGKQMDPVSEEEIQAMIARRQLQPTDLVWSEGMPQWAAARTIPELFPAPLDPPPPIAIQPSPPIKVKSEGTPLIANSNRVARDEDDRPSGPSRRGRAPEDDEDEYLLRPARTRARERQRDRQSSGAGMVILAVLGIGVVLLVFGGVIALVLAFSKGTPTYQVKALPPMSEHLRVVQLEQGGSYEFTVHGRPNHAGIDIDLIVTDKQNQTVGDDLSIGPDSNLVWTVFPGGEYTVRVRNLNNVPVDADVWIQPRSRHAAAVLVNAPPQVLPWRPQQNFPGIPNPPVFPEIKFKPPVKESPKTELKEEKKQITKVIDPPATQPESKVKPFQPPPKFNPPAPPVFKRAKLNVPQNVMVVLNADQEREYEVKTLPGKTLVAEAAPLNIRAGLKCRLSACRDHDGELIGEAEFEITDAEKKSATVELRADTAETYRLIVANAGTQLLPVRLYVKYKD